MNQQVYVVILAGGQGTRFWPKSRSNYPKQFIDILGQGKSLLKATFDRYKKIVPANHIFVITNKKYVGLVKEHLPLIEDTQIISEPFSRNTATCIAYAAYKIQSIDPKAVLVIAPSDHLIKDEAAFAKALKKACNYAKTNDVLLTLGMVPNRPDINYGYIQHLDQANENGVFKVKTFTEKPNLELAEEFLRSGDFLWNAGIFIWKANVIIDSFRQYIPEISELFEMYMIKLNTIQETEYVEKIYGAAPSISIDYGVMEKASNVYVIPADFGWSDLGTWSSTWEQSQKDEQGNAAHNNGIKLYECENNIVQIPKNKIAYIQGVEGLVVIDTGDVLMICKKEDDHFVKTFLQSIKDQKKDELL